MSFGSLLLLAIGLAMDAAAVAATRGMAAPKILPRHVLLTALFFGGFQALMPALGWWLGSELGDLIQAWDHWLIFILLSALGGKMLWEAYQESRGAGEEESSSSSSPLKNPFALRVLLLLAIATSIDAFGVGFTLPLLDAPFTLSLFTIGGTAALLSSLSLFAGRRFGALLGSRLDALGGFILIALGTKILIEHLVA